MLLIRDKQPDKVNKTHLQHLSASKSSVVHEQLLHSKEQTVFEYRTSVFIALCCSLDHQCDSVHHTHTHTLIGGGDLAPPGTPSEDAARTVTVETVQSNAGT